MDYDPDHDETDDAYWTFDRLQTWWLDVCRCSTIRALSTCCLAMLLGCDATGLTVEQTTDAPQDVPQAIQPLPAPVPPPPAPVAPPPAIPAPLPAPVPPQTAPVQPPAAPEAPLPAPIPPPAVPPCFDRDLGDVTVCEGYADCATSSTVTARTMCQSDGVLYVPDCSPCSEEWR